MTSIKIANLICPASFQCHQPLSLIPTSLLAHIGVFPLDTIATLAVPTPTPKGSSTTLIPLLQNSCDSVVLRLDWFVAVREYYISLDFPPPNPASFLFFKLSPLCKSLTTQLICANFITPGGKSTSITTYYYD
jgi:hypothetical protein